MIFLMSHVNGCLSSDLEFTKYGHDLLWLIMEKMHYDVMIPGYDAQTERVTF